MNRPCRALLVVSASACLLVLAGLAITNHSAEKLYQNQLSPLVTDRHGKIVRIAPNNRTHYTVPVQELPEGFTELLLRKEDQWFYWHPGLHPWRTLTAGMEYLSTGQSSGASTLTQQLAKNLLQNETDRTLTNKAHELWYSLAMEVFWRKDTILEHYLNTVYLGNQLQGFETASYGYFGKTFASTTPAEQVALLATLSNPTTRNPWEADNSTYRDTLGQTLGVNNAVVIDLQTDFALQASAAFELTSLDATCRHCMSTIDSNLTDALRNILARHVAAEQARGVRSGAIVVLDAHTSEVLALIGSPHPERTSAGNQINMAISARPVGSTIKPFIYGNGFAAGLRPYSLVDDREYKYPIATGYSLYPKNYDGQFRGEVTLHDALSNSLNVPTVKTLEYVGLDTFYTFMETELGFQPLQDWEQYQYGIALGGLEMDLLTLTHFFSTFPNNGTLSPLTIYQDEVATLPPQADITTARTVFSPADTEFITAILNDRLTGVNQFGLKNNLSLPITNYAVKTGTSRDYHDSWVVGYTPDLVVGVWLGNTENEALAQVSGQTGAGAVWHDVMAYLSNTPYYTDTPFTFSHIALAPAYGSEEWQLPGESLADHRFLLLQDQLITNPHSDDTFELFPDLTIPLHASTNVSWFVNGEQVGTGANSSFTPKRIGRYEITATSDTDSETIDIIITQPESP